MAINSDSGILAAPWMLKAMTFLWSYIKCVCCLGHHLHSHKTMLRDLNFLGRIRADRWGGYSSTGGSETYNTSPKTADWGLHPFTRALHQYQKPCCLFRLKVREQREIWHKDTQIPRQSRKMPCWYRPLYSFMLSCLNSSYLPVELSACSFVTFSVSSRCRLVVARRISSFLLLHKGNRHQCTSVAERISCWLP